MAVPFNFKFEGTTKPYSTFFRGAFSGDPRRLRPGIILPDLKRAESTLPFIQTMRQICETIFDLLFCGYITSIEAFRNKSDT